MMGLLALGYLALVTVLGIASIAFLIQLISSFGRNKPWERYFMLLFLTAAPFIFLTWPFIAGRMLYEANCYFAAGLSVTRTIDASSTGYFLDGSTSSNGPSGAHYSYHPYSRQAVADLKAGRIAFFEGSGSYYGGLPEYPYYQIFLADSNSRYCINPTSNLAGVVLPNGKCLAEKAVKVLESKYVVRGYGSHNNRTPNSVSFAMLSSFLMSSSTLASYRKFELSRPLFNSLSCPAEANSAFSAQQAISTVVLQDANGKTLSQTDFDNFLRQANLFKLSRVREFPPGEFEFLKTERNAATCTSDTFGSGFETHKIHLHSGGGQKIEARLDSNRNSTREVRVVVNNPMKRTVLYLRAYDPVVWSISRTPKSEISGVVVSGYHGQAVLGVTRNTPIMISTHEYNPRSNCSSAEMHKVKQAISMAESGVEAQNLSLVVVGSKNYHEDSLIVSNELKLDDYTVH